jgi:hypothetical protein
MSACSRSSIVPSPVTGRIFDRSSRFLLDKRVGVVVRFGLIAGAVRSAWARLSSLRMELS